MDLSYVAVKAIRASRQAPFFYAMEISAFGQPPKGLRKVFELFQKAIDGSRYLVFAEQAGMTFSTSLPIAVEEKLIGGPDRIPSYFAMVAA